MIRVLIVEDSPTAAFMLSKIFTSDPAFEVVAIATSGKEAIKKVADIKPDIISMDLELPDINGLEVTRHIMANTPTPIVVVSGDQSPDKVNLSLRALDAGALAAIAKPKIQDAAELELLRQELIFTFKAMSEIRVIRRRASSQQLTITTPNKVKDKTAPQIIAIGSSTGGPQALQDILKNLPANFPLPIVIVQHISTGFAEGLAKWLGLTCKLPVQLARHGVTLTSGHVYIAPEEQHLEITDDHRFQLVQGAKEHGVCPSVSYFLPLRDSNLWGKYHRHHFERNGERWLIRIKTVKRHWCSYFCPE